MSTFRALHRALHERLDHSSAVPVRPAHKLIRFLPAAVVARSA
ncbi:hypothetical protein [Streptomyces canus]|nr:hypothetical protein [Streptomyces canus]